MALILEVGNYWKDEKAFKACKKYQSIILDKTNKSVVFNFTAINFQK